MMIEGAIGDTYGAGFEFANRHKIENKNTLECYERHPIYFSVYKKYTDDTQMAMAIAELITEEKEWNELVIANKFVEAFKRDPREGYGYRMLTILKEVNTGEEFLRKISNNSERNGAAMRAYPIGVLKSEKEVLEKSKLQAMITHNTEIGIQSSQAISIIAHYFLYAKGKKESLNDYLLDVQGIRWGCTWKGEVQIHGTQTVEAVLTILKSGISLSQMLKDAIELGGDVDTVGSLVLALGSCSDEIKKDLPDWMYDDLENGKYGKDYLISLDKELILN